MPKVQTPYQFLQEFHECVEKAEYRIYIQSMNFENGEVFRSLKPLLVEKARQGVDVRMKIDWVAKKYTRDGVAFFPAFTRDERKKRTHFVKEIQDLEQELKAGGVKIDEVHQPTFTSRLVPILNRDHKKIYLVDEKIAWIGGVNLIDSAFTNVDCMIRSTDNTYITTIANAFLSNNTKDKVTTISPDSSILFDGGKRNSSVIYDTALTMSQRSQRKIIFISQFLPDGPLLDILIRKRLDGLRIEVYTSPVDNSNFTKFPYNILFPKLRHRLESHGIPIHFLTKKVHAKVLMVDDKSILIGSHNLVDIGVKLGTSEIAIWSQNNELLQSFREFYYYHVMKYDYDSSNHLPYFI